MKIALLADPHLSDVESTPQEESFLWAIQMLSEFMPDACVWLGDITACGSADAAMRFRKQIDQFPFPSVTVPGNSDLRSTTTASTLERFFLSHPEGLHFGDFSIVGIDTSHNTILPCERWRLSKLTTQKRILLCSHQPAKYLDADSLNFLRGWIRKHQAAGHRFLLWASGHRHVFDRGEFEGIPTVTVRTLDLDKSIHGPGQILVWDPDTLEFEEHVYSRGLPKVWSHAQQQELADLLGITCYERHKLERDMPFAIENSIRHLEWKNISEDEIPLIEAWRRSGGQTFSLHLPSLNYDGTVTGLPAFRSKALNAIRAGADMVTVHPPQIPNDQMQIGSPVFDAVADSMVESLLPVAQAGIDILVENNHTEPGSPRDPAKCAFGCTPIDLVTWRDALNHRLGASACHIRLDVGHARNNVPFSEAYPIGKWYATIGSECRAYHLHQTIHNKATRIMENHHPITCWNGDMISFDGFLWAWHTGMLHHGPVILEIREGEGACATWQRLHSLLLEDR